jgi:hypothetical protein
VPQIALLMVTPRSTAAASAYRRAT